MVEIAPPREWPVTDMLGSGSGLGLGPGLGLGLGGGLGLDVDQLDPAIAATLLGGCRLEEEHLGEAEASRWGSGQHALQLGCSLDDGWLQPGCSLDEAAPASPHPELPSSVRACLTLGAPSLRMPGLSWHASTVTAPGWG